MDERAILYRTMWLVNYLLATIIEPQKAALVSSLTVAVMSGNHEEGTFSFFYCEGAMRLTVSSHFLLMSFTFITDLHGYMEGGIVTIIKQLCNHNSLPGITIMQCVTIPAVNSAAV